MCMTVLEGNYTLRETVTSEGVRLSFKTLQGQLAAWMMVTIHQGCFGLLGQV